MALNPFCDETILFSQLLLIGGPITNLISECENRDAGIWGTIDPLTYMVYKQHVIPFGACVSIMLKIMSKILSHSILVDLNGFSVIF